MTALEAAIGRGDIALTTQLLDWGAPTGDGLKAAIQARSEPLVRLLIQRGANPVEYRSYHSDGSPLTWVIEQAPELLPALLSQPSEATIKALREEAPQLLRQALESPKAGQASPFWKNDPHRLAVYNQFMSGTTPFEFTKNYKFTVLNNENVWAKAMNRILNEKVPVDKAVDELIARIKAVAAN